MASATFDAHPRGILRGPGGPSTSPHGGKTRVTFLGPQPNPHIPHARSHKEAALGAPLDAPLDVYDTAIERTEKFLANYARGVADRSVED
jgi:hypothetical protein